MVAYGINVLLTNPTFQTGIDVDGNADISGTITAGPVGAPILELEASSGGSGQALINGTGNLLTWTAPADGQLHEFNLTSSLKVTSAQTGGEITVAFTGPGGTAEGPVIAYAGTLGLGETEFQLSRAVEAGTTVTVAQATAQTAGAATFYGRLSGA